MTTQNTPMKGKNMKSATSTAPVPVATATANASPDMAAMLAELAVLRAQNEALKAQAARRSAAGEVTACVSGLGAISVYGLGQFPVTLYAEQWERLLAVAGNLTTFIAAVKETRVHYASMETVFGSECDNMPLIPLKDGPKPLIPEGRRLTPRTAKLKLSAPTPDIHAWIAANLLVPTLEPVKGSRD